ncbi:metallophosphoesterase [Rhodopirellula sp. SWK7]|uniref:metallophosphoesterase n=1 Tax=Rhodopirellula sp. SWK7 TaxID=595460 RepID=UPI0002BD5C6A|nr:metallophosphoesterase [Rhodopirellula sp. SWK7]EMI44546.1 metallophosphoesterase [Rhodopirellula sp. SWK7]
MAEQFDIIGDIHGHGEELKALLSEMGYSRQGQGFRHPDRKVVFVGDFVDRGPAIAEVIAIARAMEDAGDARAVMGNHEYNAIAFHTPRPGKCDEWFRSHSDKNRKQHQATLDQLSPNELADAITWFKTLPVAIELGGMRVAHASWQKRDIDCINDALVNAGRFTPDFLAMSEDAGSDLNIAIENVLKGPELRMPDGHSIVDKAGHQRDSVRIKWYEDGAGRTYRQHHLGSDEVPDVEIATDDLASVDIYPRDAVPVFVGHYWLTGTPTPLAANVACTDYSVAKNGKLVGYRWDGESVLNADKFHWVEAE